MRISSCGWDGNLPGTLSDLPGSTLSPPGSASWRGEARLKGCEPYMGTGLAEVRSLVNHAEEALDRMCGVSKEIQTRIRATGNYIIVV